MNNIPNLGRAVCQAVGQATGLRNITAAIIDTDCEDVTRVTVTFIASNQQVQEIGKFLGESPNPRETLDVTSLASEPGRSVPRET